MPPSLASSDMAGVSDVEFKLTGDLPEGWKISFPVKNQGQIFRPEEINWDKSKPTSHNSVFL